ncbi:cytochrome P450 81Q32-like [Vitis riparia]|uniref:cytochrome P450 81Q32-like n=1 Tax=Vitis riparia TaxID=96939 RepID=UPI00155A9777|nr:cytochrome P450 81Q32-like [Vitis riparia]
MLYTALFIFCLILLKVFVRGRRRHGNLPPSPPPLPIIGHLHLVRGGGLHRTFRSLSEKYGPILFLQLGWQPTVIVSSPSVVEECFTKNDIVLANRPLFLLGKYLGYNFTALAWAGYGDHWRNLRRLSTLEVFSPSRLDLIVGIQKDEVKCLLQRLSPDSRDGFGKVELKSKFSELTFNIITRAVAGKRFYGEDVDAEVSLNFRNLINEIFQSAEATNPADLLPIFRWIDYQGFERKMIEVSGKSDVFMQGLIDEHRSDRSSLESRNTMIDHLLSLQKSQPEYYTDEIIKGLIMVLILAGTETSATTTEWAMALLLNHPNSLKKAIAEIDNRVGQERIMDETDLPNLPYLQNIVRETLRLYPPGPLLVPHVSSEECEIGGYHIPKHTMVMVNAWAIQRDPKLWHDATSFRPERFETGKAETYKFLPYGVGRRACPGASMANRLIGLTLGTLIQCYSWERVSDKEVDMTGAEGLTMPKKTPLEAMCKPRDVLKKVFEEYKTVL